MYYTKIVLCKTALIQLEKDLYKGIYKKEICKDVCYLARLNLGKDIFKAENETIYKTNDHL